MAKTPRGNYFSTLSHDELSKLGRASYRKAVRDGNAKSPDPILARKGAMGKGKSLEKLSLPFPDISRKTVSVLRASALVGVHPRTMWRWIEKGNVAVKRTGSRGGKSGNTSVTVDSLRKWHGELQRQFFGEYDPDLVTFLEASKVSSLEVWEIAMFFGQGLIKGKIVEGGPKVSLRSVKNFRKPYWS